MTRHTRFIAGILTSLVLILSLVEGAWAATCTPTMDMSAATAAASHEMPESDGRMPGSHGERDRQDAPACPFGPAGAAQGCAVAASLPAAGPVGLTPAPEGAEVVIASETEPHFLLGSGLFHPPKA